VLRQPCYVKLANTNHYSYRYEYTGTSSAAKANNRGYGLKNEINTLILTGLVHKSDFQIHCYQHWQLQQCAQTQPKLRNIFSYIIPPCNTTTTTPA